MMTVILTPRVTPSTITKKRIRQMVQFFFCIEGKESNAIRRNVPIILQII